MPKPTPFHPRTQALCSSYNWTSWAGYYAVNAYDVCHEREYNAFRQGTGVIDVTPLYKYDIKGPDAATFLSWLTVRDVTKLKVNRATYLCWTDQAGKVIDDGTCARLGDEDFRLTAAEPMYHWFVQNARGFDVEIQDVSGDWAALAIQGPTARDLLRDISHNIDADGLRFFGVAQGQLAGAEAVVTRTGYTGDLGYELWVRNHDALTLWDTIMDVGRAHGIYAAGLDALDVCRVEAGFIMMGVDYIGAFDAVIASQKSSPYEIGLGWTVKLEREPFIGQSALQSEHGRSQKWATVGLEVDWVSLESLYDEYGLPPSLPATAWRTSVPIYRHGRQIGRATSGSWSPILKRNLALATIEADCAQIGTQLEIEVTVEWTRKTVPAKVVKTPFFDPPRKKAVISNV
jgi:aminomethyltransferase